MAKKQVVCDTDVMIDYWDTTSKRPVQTKEVLENTIGLDNVVISAILRMELLMGAGSKEEQTKIKKNVLRFNTALINNEITEEAIDLLETYRLSHSLAIPDCFIAATSKITGLALFTYNVKDYKFIRELKLYEKNTSE
jgi:predicted nucleic acid-binding protein